MEKIFSPFFCEEITALDRWNALPAWGTFCHSKTHPSCRNRNDHSLMYVIGMLMKKQTAWCICAPPTEIADTDEYGSLNHSRTHSPGNHFALPTQLMISKCQNECIENVPVNLSDKWFLPSCKCIKAQSRKIFHQHNTFSEQGKIDLNLCTSLSFPNICRFQIRANTLLR